jgi:hypothetical protein
LDTTLETVKAKKNVLIITEGSDKTLKMAKDIALALKGNKVSVKTASEFKGNDVLPAEVFFLGCEKPRPGSFAYLTDVLKHINLAGRRCGIFTSGSEKTARYLAGLVKDCEASLNPEPLFASSGIGAKVWAQNVIANTF